jgi:hypothetical protein
MKSSRKEKQEEKQEGRQLVDANGQIHIFPSSEGLPEDFEDEQRVKARTARLEAEDKKERVDMVKKRILMLSRIRDREAHYRQVLDVIDEARLESLKHPDEVFIAADHENDPKVMTLKDWKKWGFQGNSPSAALYAIWMNEQEKTWDEVKDLVDAEDSEEDAEPVDDEDEYPEEDDEAIEALNELVKETLEDDGAGEAEGVA